MKQKPTALRGGLLLCPYDKRHAFRGAAFMVETFRRFAVSTINF
jgi:hypothetical protein